MVKIKYAHLSSGFMLTSMLGLIVSAFFVWKLSVTWGFTFVIFFGIMFVASILSMTHADFSAKEDQDELAVHEKVAKKKWK